MQTVRIIGLVSVITSLLLMVIGHLGAHELNWLSYQISTYAATAPYDYFVTTSMVLSALSLLIIGVLISRDNIIGTNYFAHLVPALSGAAASGLIIVAYFEETAQTLSLLKQSGFWAIRVQTFHDAGLLIFFYSSVLLVILAGILIILYKSNIITKVLGGVILSMGPLSYVFMTTNWPKLIGLEGVTIGIKQRAALLCLWLAIALILAMASNKRIKSQTRALGRTNVLPLCEL